MNTTAIPSSASATPWLKRSSTLIVVALLVVTVCWLADVPKLLSQWANQKDKVEHSAQPITQPLAAPTAAIGITPPAPTGNDSSLSKVPLPLLLTGTMPGRNAHEGQAFIGINKDSPQTYAAGAILANGARIAEIHTDHVVLQRDGQSVNLYLQGAGHSVHTNAMQSNLLTVGGTTTPKPAIANSHEVLTDYIRPSPKYDGDTLRGYEVYAGQQSSVFSQLGLQPGDVITSINSMPLNEPASAIDQLRQLTQGIAVTATIERKGQVQTIALDGSLITKDQQRIQNAANTPLPTSLPAM